MEILGSILNLLTELGKIVNFENQTVIQDRIKELRGLYDTEIAKGPDRDDALIYSLRVELRDICELYCATIKGSAPEG